MNRYFIFCYYAMMNDCATISICFTSHIHISITVPFTYKSISLIEYLSSCMVELVEVKRMMP